jgi:AraC-like DNA-binding protein
LQNRSSQPPLPAIYEDAAALDETLRILNPAVCELKIYDVTYLHYHSVLELGWCVSGSGECYAEDRVFPFSAGDIQIIFPYQKHYNRSRPGGPSRWHFISLNPATLLPSLGFLSPPVLEEWLQNEMGLFGVFSRAEQPQIHEPAVHFFREILSSGSVKPRRRELCGALLCELLCELSRGSAALPKLTLQQNPVLTQVSPALRQIQRQLAQGTQPTVASLAALCSMSEPNFRRVFRRATGSAPKEYILHAAVHRAEQLLLSTDEEILQIASEAGFADVSGLNRQFLDKNGVSPSRFRILHRR